MHNSLNHLESTGEETFKNSTHDDLDEYASNNETSFVRRSSIRLSRKSTSNPHQRPTMNGSGSFLGSSSNVSQNNVPNESNFLINFLNNGLEQNRELLPSPISATSTATNVSSNRHGIVITSNIDFDAINTSDNVNSVISSDATSARKRQSSIECNTDKNVTHNRINIANEIFEKNDTNGKF